MRHRAGIINTGLGNSSPCLLPNTWSDNEKLNEVAGLLLQEALELEPIKEYGGLDFKIEQVDKMFFVDFGYEPAYQYDKLVLYHIENNKNNCMIRLGVAEGAYGSNIRIFKEFDYNNCNSDFKDLIDKWHSKLVKCI